MMFARCTATVFALTFSFAAMSLFDNPSQITHDVCIDSPSGQEIGCSQTISDDSTSLSESLKPGKYTFFCSVDGHEAAGMKGTLTLD